MAKMVEEDRLVKNHEAQELLSCGRTHLHDLVRSGILTRVYIGGKDSPISSSGFLYSDLMRYLDPNYEPKMVPYRKRVHVKKAAEIFSVTPSTISRWEKNKDKRYRVLPKQDNRCNFRGWAYGDLMKVLYGEFDLKKSEEDEILRKSKIPDFSELDGFPVEITFEMFQMANYIRAQNRANGIFMDDLKIMRYVVDMREYMPKNGDGKFPTPWKDKKYESVTLIG